MHIKRDSWAFNRMSTKPMWIIWDTEDPSQVLAFYFIEDYDALLPYRYEVGLTRGRSHCKSQALREIYELLRSQGHTLELAPEVMAIDPNDFCLPDPIKVPSRFERDSVV